MDHVDPTPHGPWVTRLFHLFSSFIKCLFENKYSKTLTRAYGKSYDIELNSKFFLIDKILQIYCKLCKTRKSKTIFILQHFNFQSSGQDMRKEWYIWCAFGGVYFIGGIFFFCFALFNLYTRVSQNTFTFSSLWPIIHGP